jgi:hypothetical protein
MIENMATLQKMDYPASLMGAIKQTIPIWYTRENGVLGLSPLSDKEIADAFIQAEKDISNGTSYLEMYFKDKKTMQEISDTYEISRATFRSRCERIIWKIFSAPKFRYVTLKSPSDFHSPVDGHLWYKGGPITSENAKEVNIYEILYLGLSCEVYNVLRRAGYNTLGDILEGFTTGDILDVRGLGPKRLNEVVRIIETHLHVNPLSCEEVQQENESALKIDFKDTDIHSSRCVKFMTPLLSKDSLLTNVQSAFDDDDQYEELNFAEKYSAAIFQHAKIEDGPHGKLLFHIDRNAQSLAYYKSIGISTEYDITITVPVKQYKLLASMVNAKPFYVLFTNKGFIIIEVGLDNGQYVKSVIAGSYKSFTVDKLRWITKTLGFPKDSLVG